MKKSISLFICLLCSIVCMAQKPVTQTGTVRKIKYDQFAATEGVSGVIITVDKQNAHSKPEFSIQIKPVNNKFKFSNISKQGFKLITPLTDENLDVSPSGITIIMVSEQDFKARKNTEMEKMIAQYESDRLKTKKRIREFDYEIEELKSSEKQNHARILELEKERDALTERLGNVEKIIGSDYVFFEALANEFALTDYERADSITRRNQQLAREGKWEELIRINQSANDNDFYFKSLYSSHSEIVLDKERHKEAYLEDARREKASNEKISEEISKLTGLADGYFGHGDLDSALVCWRWISLVKENNIANQFKVAQKYRQYSNDQSYADTCYYRIVCYSTTAKEKARAYNGLAEIQMELSNYNRADSLLNLSLQLIEDIDDADVKCDTYVKLSALSQIYGNFGKAKDFALKAKGVAGNNETTALTKFEIGKAIAASYRSNWNFKDAISVLEDLQGKMPDPDEYTMEVCEYYSQVVATKIGYGQFKDVLPICNENKLIIEKISPSHRAMASVYNNYAQYYLTIAQYDSAEVYFDKALAIHKQSYKEDNTNIAGLYVSKAGILHKRGKFKEALSLLDDAIQLIETKFTKNHFNSYSAYCQKADIMNDAGNIYEAFNIYAHLQEIVKSTFNEENQAYYDLCGKIGSIKMILGQYDEASANFKQYQESVKNTYGTENPAYASSLLMIGELNQNLARFNDAATCYEQAQNILEKVYDEKHFYAIDCYEKRSSLYLTIGDVNKAKALEETVLEIRQKVLGANNPLSYSAISGLAEIYNSSSDFKKAKELTDSATAGLAQYFDANSIVMGRQYAQTANLALTMADYALADSLYRRNVEICENTFGVQSINTYVAITLQASLFETMGEYGKAIEVYSEALKENVNLYGSLHPNVATLKMHIANVKSLLGDYRGGEQKYEECAKDYKKLYNSDKHPALGNVFNALGRIKQELGYYNVADSLFHKSYNIYENAYGKDNLTTAVPLTNLADLYTTQGNYKEALEILTTVENSLRLHFGNTHPNVAVVLRSKANVYSNIADLKNAEICMKESKNICSKVQGEDHPNTARVVCDLAQIYSNMANYSKADSLCKVAYNIVRQKYGEDNINTYSIKDVKAQILQATGNFEEAELLYISEIEPMISVYGENHAYVSGLYFNLSTLSFNKCNLIKAEEFALKGHDIVKKTLGAKHPYYFKTLTNIANIYINKGEYSRADSLLNIVLENQERIFGSNSIILNNAKFDKANILLNLAKFDEAISIYNNTAVPLKILWSK